MELGDKTIIFFILNGAASVVGTIATIGIGLLLKNQANIKVNIEKATSVLTKLVQCHHINHPDQLKND